MAVCGAGRGAGRRRERKTAAQDHPLKPWALRELPLRAPVPCTHALARRISQWQPAVARLSLLLCPGRPAPSVLPSTPTASSALFLLSKRPASDARAPAACLALPCLQRPCAIGSASGRLPPPSSLLPSPRCCLADDVKALLVSASQHREKNICLRAVVCNGGGQPRARAALARCLLDHLGVYDVPVGVGSEGRPYQAQPHEYALDGYEAVDASSLPDGSDLMLRVLREAAPKRLLVVLISSLRDFADLLAAEPDLCVAKIDTVAVMGGLDPDLNSESGWKPDTSVNNGFDAEAAARVYAFCFAHGVRLTVTSRHAVPLLPMQLAKSFAERTQDPVRSLRARSAASAGDYGGRGCVRVG